MVYFQRTNYSFYYHVVNMRSEAFMNVCKKEDVCKEKKPNYLVKVEMKGHESNRIKRG